VSSAAPPLRTLSRPLQPPVDRVPVDGVPPGGDIVRALVLVPEVVRVLPDVDAQDGSSTLHDRVVLVREPLDGQLAAGEVGPAPTGPELADRRLRERVLEG